MGTPNFNPLPPHGGRRVSQDSYNPRISFQSTPSAWRETVILALLVNALCISIHSLRMEGDDP